MKGIEGAGIIEPPHEEGEGVLLTDKERGKVGGRQGGRKQQWGPQGGRKKARTKGAPAGSQHQGKKKHATPPKNSKLDTSDEALKRMLEPAWGAMDQAIKEAQREEDERQQRGEVAPQDVSSGPRLENLKVFKKKRAAQARRARQAGTIPAATPTPTEEVDVHVVPEAVEVEEVEVPTAEESEDVTEEGVEEDVSEDAVEEEVAEDEVTDEVAPLDEVPELPTEEPATDTPEVPQDAEDEAEEVDEPRERGIPAPENYVPISEDAILAAESFDDLEAALDTGDGLDGSHDYFEAALLHDIVARVRSGEYETHHLTRTHHLRDKVEELLAKEQGAPVEEPAVVEVEEDESFEEPVTTIPLGSAPKLEAVQEKKTPPPIPDVYGPLEDEMLQGSVSELPDIDALMGAELSFEKPGTKRGITKKQKSAILREVAQEAPDTVGAHKTQLMQRFKSADQTALRLSVELESVKEIHRKRVLNPFTRFFVKHFGYGLKDQRRIRALEHSYETAVRAAEDARNELAALDKAEPTVAPARTRPRRGRAQGARL
ncbi:MAG: hypothetical protein RL150_511 [Candidatus Parcubacteria bacterium]